MTEFLTVVLGALVHVARIPNTYGKKAGIDDALAEGATEADVLSWILPSYDPAATVKKCVICSKPLGMSSPPNKMYCGQECRDEASRRSAEEKENWMREDVERLKRGG